MISGNLRILLLASGLALALFMIILLKKNKIPIRHSLFWFACSIIIMAVGATPGLISKVTRLVGFEASSNLIIGLILSMLLIIILMLTLVISDHNKKIVLLTQEISMLKKEKNKGE